MSKEESRILLPTFGAHVFGLDPNPDIPTMHVPPLIESKTGWDLDYSALLLFDKVVIDSLAKNVIGSSSLKDYKQLKESLHILEEEGKAEFLDYNVITQRTSDELERILKSELRDPLHWMEESRVSVLRWKEMSKDLFKKTDHVVNDFDEVSFAIWFYLKKHGLSLERKEMERIEGLFLSKKRRFSSIEEDIIYEVSKTYLTAVNHTLLLSRETNSAAYDWKNVELFYQTIFMRAVSTQGQKLNEQDKIRELFNISVPDYRPEKAIDFVKLQNDKRIKHLRSLVKDATINNTQFDREFYIKTLEQMVKDEKKKKKSRIRKALLSAPLLFLEHFFPPIGIIREAVLAGDEIVSDKFGNKGHQWLLLLTDSK